MAHLDVVPAVTESWDTDPYQMVEKDGFLYGRGTSDNKGGAAALITTFIRLKTEGFVPDLIPMPGMSVAPWTLPDLSRCKPLKKST